MPGGESLRNALAADLMNFRWSTARIQTFGVARFVPMPDGANLNIGAAGASIVGFGGASIFVLVSTAASPPSQQFVQAVQHLLNTSTSHLFRLARCQYPEIGVVFMLMHVGWSSMDLNATFA